MEQREGVQQDNNKGGFARAPHGTAGEQGIMQLGRRTGRRRGCAGPAWAPTRTSRMESSGGGGREQ
jgi:hypothetical protein